MRNILFVGKMKWSYPDWLYHRKKVAGATVKRRVRPVADFLLAAATTSAIGRMASASAEYVIYVVYIVCNNRRSADATACDSFNVLFAGKTAKVKSDV